MMVPRNDETTRLCIDFQNVNDLAKFDACPISQVEGLIKRIAGAQFNTTLDFTKEY